MKAARARRYQESEQSSWTTWGSKLRHVILSGFGVVAYHSDIRVHKQKYPMQKENKRHPLLSIKHKHDSLAVYRLKLSFRISKLLLLKTKIRYPIPCSQALRFRDPSTNFNSRRYSRVKIPLKPSIDQQKISFVTKFVEIEVCSRLESWVPKVCTLMSSLRIVQIYKFQKRLKCQFFQHSQL